MVIQLYQLSGEMLSSSGGVLSFHNVFILIHSLGWNTTIKNNGFSPISMMNQTLRVQQWWLYKLTPIVLMVGKESQGICSAGFQQKVYVGQRWSWIMSMWIWAFFSCQGWSFQWHFLGVGLKQKNKCSPRILRKWNPIWLAHILIKWVVVTAN